MFQLLFLVIGGGLADQPASSRCETRCFTASPGEDGYYQRQVLDKRLARNQMRMLGMIGSYFGLVILTAVLNGILRFRLLQSVSDSVFL